MAHALAQVRLHRATNLPEDDVVNTFHFATAPGDPILTVADANIIADRLVQFYNDPVAPSTSTVGGVLSPAITSHSHQVKVYSMSEPEPRSPLITRAWGFTAAMAGQLLPGELAICLSFRANYVSGVPAARRKGRIYLGPIDAGGHLEALGELKVGAGYRDTIVAAALRLMNFDTGPRWAVYSRVTDPGNGGQEGLPHVVQAWVDDAWDVQRRRGSKATTRTVVTRTP